ncbi:MAG: response regulator, partial [Pseudomonadota bacterium]
ATILEDDTLHEAPISLAIRGTFDVLIVDDNLANRMVAEALVKPLGGLPVMAVDGRQAVTKASERKFDLILMDISMPVMDGIQATAAIRAGTGLSKRTPIIAVTAHASANDLPELKEQGFQDFVGKPVRKDVLTRCIEKWTERDTVEFEVAG